MHCQLNLVCCPNMKIAAQPHLTSSDVSPPKNSHNSPYHNRCLSLPIPSPTIIPLSQAAWNPTPPINTSLQLLPHSVLVTPQCPRTNTAPIHDLLNPRIQTRCQRTPEIAWQTRRIKTLQQGLKKIGRCNCGIPR